MCLKKVKVAVTTVIRQCKQELSNFTCEETEIFYLMPVWVSHL